MNIFLHMKFYDLHTLLITFVCSNCAGQTKLEMCFSVLHSRVDTEHCTEASSSLSAF